MLDAVDQALSPLKIVVVGHVDHGKSTLIGRLLNDTGALPEGKLEELKALSDRRGMPLEWSFALDAFQAERDQAITIDTTQIFFKSGRRRYVIIDAPGHREFLKNMISGAAYADAAVLVIDAKEGVREQSRRHAYLLRLLGLRQLTVVVNKMDAVDHDRERFAEVRKEITEHLEAIGLSPSFIIPISARAGENLVNRADATMGWYKGPTLIEALDRFAPAGATADRSLRFIVQDVYKFDERRIIAGRVESGVLQVGDMIVFAPSGRRAKVATIEHWPSDTPQIEARAGQSIGITLDEQIFVERGDVGSHEQDQPVKTHAFRATIFWLGNAPLQTGRTYRMKLGTRSVPVMLRSIDKVIDTTSLEGLARREVRRDDVAEVILRSPAVLALDSHNKTPALGRFVLVDAFDTVGGGVISLDEAVDEGTGPIASNNVESVRHLVTDEARAHRNGHQGAVLWLTGLSGSGKSTIAMEVERRLFERGMQVYVLDGDNLRQGLNADLGFTHDDRVENIRRAGHVAALFAQAGFVVLVSFISPYRIDRQKARDAARATNFLEIYVKADLETCETRDPKGLYRRARTGEIADFTGVSAPYEVPERPDFVLDTEQFSVDELAGQLIRTIEKQLSWEPNFTI